MKKFGELFGESLKEYGNKFVTILKTFLTFQVIPLVGALILFLILAILLWGKNLVILTLMLQADKTEGSLINQLANLGIPLFGFIGLILFFYLVITLITVFSSVAYTHIAFSNEKELSLKQIFNFTKKHFWKYFGLSLLLFISLAGLFFLLIIPAIIFFVYWAFSSYVLINENKGIKESMRKSKELVKGRWWSVFGFFLLLCLIDWAFNLVTAFIPVLGNFFNSLVAIPFTFLFFKNMYLSMKSKEANKKEDKKLKGRSRKK
jgi:hypothetical protein